MTKKIVEVTLDSREPITVKDQLMLHEEVKWVEETELPACDIEISGVGFERKTLSDYINSLTKGRLQEQRKKMSQRYEEAYILLEADLFETESPVRSDMEAESIRGSIASITARENTGVNAVVPCSSPEMLIDMAVRLARKHIEEAEDDFLPTGEVDTGEPTSLMMYGCIDGVGPMTARRIHAKWPSITDFIENSDMESLQEIEGIGKETALSIIEQLVAVK